MKPLGIRARVLLAALLPAILVAVVLSVVFVVGQVSELDNVHEQRAVALARQLASAAEFPLFARNQSYLQALVQAASREDDVKAVSIVGRDGEELARSGTATVEPQPWPPPGTTRERVQDLRRMIVHPVAATELEIDPLFESTSQAKGSESRVLGYVVLELTREDVAARQRALLVAGTLTTLAGLLFGCLLAIQLSRGVTKPILRVSQAVERVGRGDLAARVESDPASPLRPLEDGINRMTARIAENRDELERRIAEATQELRAKKEEAEEANSAKTRFLAAASHDLRQPIHALRLSAEVLRDEVAQDGRARTLLDHIQASIDAASGMFDALLDLSKLEAGVIEKAVRDFPVDALLRHLETMFTPLALRQGLRFSVVRTKLWVRSDPALLERLLQNLISNAMKYTRAGGVVVGCRRRAGAVSIEVWDSGVGIAPELTQKIFQEFFQIQNSSGEKGLGLGLAIVERISRLLGHPLRMRSRPGRGSMFAIDLPRGTPVEPPVEPPITAPTDFTGLCVAVVDDDWAIIEAMTQLLQRWGCRVLSSRSGAELLAILAYEPQPVDLVICDYRLQPGMNGIMVIESIRQALGKTVPALLVTGDTAAERLKEAQDSGFDLLHKPVSPAKLREAMQRLIANSGGPPPPRHTT